MNTVKHILTCAGLATLVTSCASNLTPPSGPSQSESPVPAGASSSERAIAQRVYSLVNSRRASAGKRALRGHPGLNSMAEKHSARLANGYVESGTITRNSRAQYAYLRHNIENMTELTYRVPAGVSDPAGKAVAAWSQGGSRFLHSWQVCGVGVEKTPGATYVTMCIGSQPTGVPRSVSPIGW